MTRGLRRARVRVDAAVEFLREETVGGVALLAATAAALIWANAGDSYLSFWHTDLTLGVGSLAITEDLQHWVNDGLMVLFFFVVALEVKREFVTGELRDRKAATLPVLAALGGATLPAAIFVLLTLGSEGASGWAIPTATDIAFAIGLLALLGDRIPSGVKLLLLTIAVVDDVLAIAIIAIFYSSGISLAWLGAVAAGLLGIVALRRLGAQRVILYIPLGIFVWVAMFQSGVHATIAGVAVGLLMPAHSVGGRQVLEEVEERLHPISSLLVVPLFALANAGIVLSGSTISAAARAGSRGRSRSAWSSASCSGSPAPHCSSTACASARSPTASAPTTSGASPRSAASASPSPCSSPSSPTPTPTPSTQPSSASSPARSLLR